MPQSLPKAGDTPSLDDNTGAVLKTIQKLVANDQVLRLLRPVLGQANFWSPEYRRDPHHTWKTLREDSPLVYSRTFQNWILTRHEHVNEALRSPCLSSDRSDVGAVRLVRWFNRNEPDFLDFLERNLLMNEGESHRRLRRIVSKAFTPRRVHQLRPRLEALAEELLDQASGSGEIELIQDFAYPFPVSAIAELLGIPQTDRENFFAWTAGLVQILDPLQGSDGAESMRYATRELYAYFRSLLASRRAAPQDDLMSAMIAAEDAGEVLAEGDLIALCVLLLAAGHETTANLIGVSVLNLLRHPEQRRRLQDDLELLPTAVNEFLRFESPVQMTDRAVIQDFEIAGRSFRRGQILGVSLVSANRDPAQFEDPDHLDLGREHNPHLALGQGAHFCLGAQLAKIEGEIALGAILRRFPDFRGPVDPPAWRRSAILRGPTTLPLQI